ncbi:MAG: bifunctional 4-hydroxy-3-methylbut-2-enyl diphosphate reductase/30S ribosomal protein S1 [Clostridia bacterium]|nr:bifunctional 4-hydroxy-3-methylbut-2-enyl diphosphate reductase/30S ribosomal protein S1 [Clostridia bacterium]
MRKVTVAKNAGFCFGVQRAADKIESSVNAGGKGRIYTLGHLIHNPTYNKRLEDNGVFSIDASEISKIAQQASENMPVKLFLRAHGVAAEVEKELRELSEANIFFSYEDCTCPYVKKIHKIAADYSSEDNIFILMGSESHPEVIGIMSYFLGEKYVFSSKDDFESAVKNGKLVNLHKKTPILAAQTTFNLLEWEKTQKFLKNLCTNPIIFDTICSVTEKRQLEAADLSKECDMMIVIGGKESSNTAKLAEICRGNCDNTFWIENAELTDDFFANTHEKVGIVAGASTPRDIIEEVNKKMSEQENFAQMLEETFKTLNTGDTVTGIVTKVTDADLQLDLGTKVTGVIKAEQITDDSSVKLTEMFKVGDEVEAFVIRVSDIEGVAELSKKRVDSDKNWVKIVEACNSGDILEGKVTEAVKGGVVVIVDSVKVFVPASHTGVPRDGDLSVLVGTVVKLKVIEIKDYAKKAIGSIRVVLREERKAQEAAFWAAIEEGKQFTGKVKSMTSYGAFVDLGGVDGMVHASELSWKHIKSPAEVVAIGDEITVFVKSFDVEKKRISLGYKTEDTNPWFIFKNAYNVGDVASVKIVNMMPFGAFAEIVDGVDGLIHISQIAQTRIAKPADVLEIGQVVDAKITEIDDEKKKVSLSIRALLDEAQASEEAMPESEEVVEEAAAEEAATEETAE